MNKITLSLFCLLVIAISLLIDPLAYHSFTTPKHALLTVLIPIIGLITLLKNKEVKIGLIPTLILIRIIWLSINNTDWVTHPGNDSFFLHISLLLLVLIIQQFDKRKKIIHALCWMAFIVGIIQVIVGCWQLFVFNPESINPIKTPFIGTLGTPNGVGILLTLSLFSGVYLFLRSFTKIKKILYCLGIVVIIIGLIFSESRGAWLSFIGVLVITATLYAIKNELKVLSIRIRRWKVIGTFTFLLACAVFVLYWVNPASSQGRIMIWEITSEMIADNPIIGVGQGNYSVEYLNYQSEYFSNSDNQQWQHKAANIKQAHNEFLQSAAEGGIVGGILFSFIWFFPILFAYKSTKRFQRSSLAQIIPLTIVGAILIHSLVDTPLHVLPVTVIGYSFLALIPQPKKSLRLTFISKWVSFIVLFLYFCFIGYRTLKNYPGNYEWKKGVDLVSNQKWEAAILNYEKALDRFEQKGELSYQLGSAYVFNEQYSKGIYQLNEAKKDFNDKNIYLTESYANIQLGNFDKAEQLSLTALSMYPTHLAPHLLLGEIYYEEGKIEESKTSLLKCIKEDIFFKSPETKQISKDAKQYWIHKYGELAD